jgi:uncharacterized protein
MINSGRRYVLALFLGQNEFFYALIISINPNFKCLHPMKKNYRRCISCRHVAAKEYFWRIVRTYPERQIKLDRGMGRSVYLCPQIDCLFKAKQKNRLPRSLKASVSQELYQSLENRLAKTHQN